jgi:hypothetical protein
MTDETGKKRRLVDQAIGLFADGRFKEAAALFEEVVKAHPGDALAYFNLGCAQQEGGRLSAALASYRRATSLAPKLAKAWNNLGQTLVETGALSEAADCYRRALAQDPNHVSARRSLKSTTLPDWARAMTAWQGDAVPDARLVLHSNRGIGDAIEWLRFLPWVTARAGRLQVAAQAELVDLLRQSGVDAAVAPTPADGDYVAPLSALRYLLFGDEPLPSVTFPYLNVPTDAVQRWQHGILGGGGFKVGLVWAGNPHHPTDRQRSMPFETVLPLFQIAGLRFFSLQVGAPAAAAAGHCSPLTEHLRSFADTAAAVSALDLVITVDTSVAHLAGALARPVWVLVHRNPDRRWLRPDGAPALYPTATLFRQNTPNDWTGVIRRVAEALSQEAGRSLSGA